MTRHTMRLDVSVGGSRYSGGTSGTPGYETPRPQVDSEVHWPDTDDISTDNQGCAATVAVASGVGFVNGVKGEAGNLMISDDLWQRRVEARLDNRASTRNVASSAGCLDVVCRPRPTDVEALTWSARLHVLSTETKKALNAAALSASNRW